MRTGTFDGGLLEYPDEVSFAFNRAIIRVTTGAETTFTIGNYTDIRKPKNGKIEIDVSKYMELVLAGEQSKTITITIKNANATFSFTTLCMWGVIGVGETFNAPRRIIWFRSYPFRVTMYVPQGATVEKRYDDIQDYLPMSSVPGINNFDPANSIPAAKEKAYIRVNATEGFSTFDYTFDDTFKSVGSGEVENELIIDYKDCGIYLRWIDLHGFYQYYLFDAGTEKQDTSDYGDTLTSYQDNVALQRPYGRTVKRSFNCCAVSVEEDIAETILSVAASAKVDLFHEGGFIPVRIGTTTITKSSDHLQDIEIEVLLPDKNSQTL